MKIVHLIDSFSYCDGCARVVFFLAREQKRRGHDASVIIGGGDAIALLESEGLRPLAMPSIGHRQRSARGFCEGILRLRAVLGSEKPDIVHAHHFYAANMARAALLARDSRLVQTVHANLPPGGRLPQHPARRLIAVSASTRDAIVQRLPGLAGRVDVVYNAVEFPGFERETRDNAGFSSCMSRRKGRFLVAFIGRFVDVKGWRVLIRALESLKERIPILLALAGAGEEESELKEELARARIDHELLGLLRDVKPLLEEADLLAFPSLRMEGFPIVLLEAGLAGTPVVASNTDGVPEIVEHERSGFLVPPGSAVALADAIERLREEAFRRALGEALRLRVEAEFTIGRMAEGVERTYTLAGA
jgi:glycosyltransferase involved in cell wall biosynthesis